MLFVSGWLKRVNAFPRGSPRTRFKASLGVNRALWSLLSQPFQRVDLVECVKLLLCQYLHGLLSSEQLEEELVPLCALSVHPHFPNFCSFSLEDLLFSLPEHLPSTKHGITVFYSQASVAYSHINMANSAWQHFCYTAVVMEGICSQFGLLWGREAVPFKVCYCVASRGAPGKEGESWDREEGWDGGVEMVLWGRGWRWAKFKVQSLQMWLWVESELR